MPTDQEVAQAKRIFSLMDLTSLNAADNAASIEVLCAKALLPDAHVAAICVYPQFVKQVNKLLKNTAINIATVVNFPAGKDSLDAVIHAIHAALQDGANEIDMVFPYEQFLAGNVSYVREFVRACKAACGNNTLKVILETGAFPDVESISRASELAIAAGADFLKTSTGKISIGATLMAAETMLRVIKKHPAVGLKISGGVRTIAQAMEYITLAESIMGAAWVVPAHFRIGASQLVS